MPTFPALSKMYIFSLAVALACLFTASSVAQQTAGQQAAPASPVAAQAPATGGSASVTIVVDNSKAARKNIQTIRKAALSFAQSFSARDEVALYFAADQPTLAQDFTGDMSLIANHLERVRGKGKLALLETLSQAVDHVRSDSANEQAAVVAFVNDLDAADPIAAANLEQSIRQRTGVPVFIVALRNSSWQSQELAQRIAVLSGGVAYFPSRTSELPRIANAIAARLGAAPAESHRAESEAREAPLPSLDGYSVAIVHEIPVADNPDTAALPGGDNVLLHRVLLGRLKKAQLFQEVRDGGVAADATEPVVPPNGGNGGGATSQPAVKPPAGGELELLPMVVGYRGGIRGPRDLISPFASPKLRVQIVLRDRTTRQPIAAFTEEASGAAGLLRGSDEKVQAQAMANVTNKIVSRIREMKQPSKQESKK